MNSIIDDPESKWPKGEAMSLTAELEHERNALFHIGNFCIRHGWDAEVHSVGSEGHIALKLFVIPKAAKSK